MSKKTKKYTPDVLAIGIVAFAGSAAVQRVLIQPKTEIEITEKIKFNVQGLLPFSQKYLAEITRTALNEVLPLSMSAVVTVCEKLKVREYVKKGVLWFIYDFMSKYSLNSVLNIVLGKLNLIDREKYKDVLREYFQKIITEKADRDAIIKNATLEVVKILRLITEGTVASIVFNERFADAASGTIAAAIDRFLANDAANRLADYFLKFVSQLEDVTLASFLSNMLGLSEDDLASFIDTTYDTLLGPSTVDTVKEMRVGDIAYDVITSINYNEVYSYVSGTDLMRLNVAGAMTAMSFYATAKKIARRQYKRKDKVEEVVKGMKSLFSDKEFLEGEE